MKKKALYLSIIILVVIGIFSFINIFKIGTSFIALNKYASGLDGITDTNLKKCVTDTGKSDIATIDSLDCSHRGVTSLSGISALTGLKTLVLEHNEISGEVNLAGLTALETLSLGDNKDVTSVKLYSNNIKKLYLNKTSIKDVANVYLNDKSITDATTLNQKLEALNVAYFTWNEGLENVILNNNSTLKELGIGGTGFNNSSFFASNASSFTSLETLYASHNDMYSMDLGTLELKSYTCDDCGYTTETLNKIDKSLLVSLYVPNNSLESFYDMPDSKTGVLDYPNLETIDISGNPLRAFSIAGSKVTNVTMSHLDWGVIDSEKFNYSKLTSLTMRNAGLVNGINLDKFNALENLDISNVMFGENAFENRVSDLHFQFSIYTSENAHIENINVSGVSGFSGINIDRKEGEQNPEGQEDPVIVLSSLTDLDLSYTGISGFNFEKLTGLKKLNLSGNKVLRTIELSDSVKNQLTMMGISNSGLNIDFIPFFESGDKVTSNIIETIVNASDPKIMRFTSYPGLTTLRVVGTGTLNKVTSKDSIPISDLLNLTASDVRLGNVYSVYKGISSLGYMEVKEIVPSNTTVKYHLVSERSTIPNVTIPNTVKDIIYEGMYDVNAIKITSSKYKFDDSKGVVVVGSAEAQEIIENVKLSNSEASISISEDGRKLIIKMGDTEVATYSISNANPATYVPQENPSEPDIPSGGGSHSSLDPTGELPIETSNPEQAEQYPIKQYQTVEPTATGAFISIVSLVVLIIAGVFSQFYMKKKRKEEELIEKI